VCKFWRKEKGVDLAAKENNRGGIKEWKEEDNSKKERK